MAQALGLACWPRPALVDEAMDLVPLISPVIFVLVFIEHHLRQVWLVKGRWKLSLGHAGCNYPARVRPCRPMTPLCLRPPQATSKFVFLLEPPDQPEISFRGRC